MRKPDKPFPWEHDADHTHDHDSGLTGYTGLDDHTVAPYRLESPENGRYPINITPHYSELCP